MFFAMHVLLIFYISKYSSRIPELGFCEDGLQGKGKAIEGRLQRRIRSKSCQKSNMDIFAKNVDSF